MSGIIVEVSVAGQSEQQIVTKEGRGQTVLALAAPSPSRTLVFTLSARYGGIIVEQEEGPFGLLCWQGAYRLMN